MPRKYTRRNAAATTDAFAHSLAETMRPIIYQLVRESLVEIFGDWAEKNAAKAAPKTGNTEQGAGAAKNT